jgi:hypothetical protein
MKTFQMKIRGISIVKIAFKASATWTTVTTPEVSLAIHKPSSAAVFILNLFSKNSSTVERSDVVLNYTK